MTRQMVLDQSREVFCGNGFESLLHHCAAVWQYLSRQPISSILALSATNHGIRDYVLTHLTDLRGSILHASSKEQLRDSPFNIWSALQTLSLYRMPFGAASCFANLSMQHLRCLCLSSQFCASVEVPRLTKVLAEGSLPALEELETSFGIRKISDLKHLARGSWPRLKVLKLHRSPNVSTQQV